MDKILDLGKNCLSLGEKIVNFGKKTNDVKNNIIKDIKNDVKSRQDDWMQIIILILSIILAILLIL